MGENSKIEWTDHTFNPWCGCSKASPACANCYAETWAKRCGRDFSARIRTSAANWRKPLKWDREAAAEGRRAKVMCASLSDVFEDHPDILAWWHADVVQMISSTPNLDWLLLTKRPENIGRFFPLGSAASRNVMFGITAENQAWFLRRWAYLRPVRAAGYRTFISAEPLLGPISLDLADAPDWVIVGGESGGNARPTKPDWVRDLRDQCAAGGISFMFKQWGALPPDALGRQTVRVAKAHAGRLLDGREHLAVPAVFDLQGNSTTAMPGLGGQ